MKGSWLNTLYRRCGATLAVVLVLFALAVSLVRGLLPQLDQLRANVEEYVDEQYQVDIRLGRIEAAWAAYGPELTLNDVEVPKQPGVPVSLSAEKMRFKLDFWQTLLKASPQIEEVAFDGVDVVLDLGAMRSPETSGNSDWLYELLLERLERYSITRAQVTLLHPNWQSEPIYLNEFRFVNQGQHHRGSGYLALDATDQYDEQLELSVQLRGSGYQPDKLKGQFYVAADNLDLGGWHPGQLQKQLQLSGVLNFELWSRFANRQFQTAMLEFTPSELAWNVGDSPQHFELNSGVLQWLPRDDGWQVTSRDFEMSSNGEAWQNFGVFLHTDFNGVQIYVDELELSQLQPFIALTPSVKLDNIKQWQDLNLTGLVKGLKLQHSAKGWSFGAKAEGLSWNQSDSIPGVDGLAVELAGRPTQIAAHLPKQLVNFAMDSQFSDPLKLNIDPSWLVYHAQGESASQILIPKIKLDTGNLGLDGRAAIAIAEGESPVLSLLAGAEIRDVSEIGRLFPRGAMGEDLSEYLEEALEKGNVRDAKVVWQGPLNRFPYDENDGSFQAEFVLDKGRFKFQPDWPAVTDLTLDALFEDARMDLWVQKGKLKSVNAKGAYVGIPRLQPKSRLKVEADLSAPGWQVTEVMTESALADSVGATLEIVEIQGDLSANLDLDIALYPNGNTLAQGVVSLDKIPLYVHTPGIQLTEMSGQVSFANDKVEAKTLQGKLYGQPVNLDVVSESMNQGYGVGIDLSGLWALEELPSELDNPLRDYYDGLLDWRGKLKMVFDDGGFRIQAQVRSDLEQVSLALPGKLAKTPEQKRPMRAELVGDNKQLFLGVKYDKQAEFWAGFDSETGAKIAHYDTMIGRLFKPGDKVRRDQGSISLNLEQANFDDWLPIIQSFIDSRTEYGQESLEQGQVALEQASAERTNIFPQLARVEGKFEQFELWGVPFTDLNLMAEPNREFWQVLARSPEVDAGLTFYPNWSTQGLKLVASRLYLTPSDEDSSQPSEVDSQTLAANLPPLAIDIDDFQLGGFKLGHLVLQGSPGDKGYQIQTLQLDDEFSELRGKGWWYHVDNDITEIEFSVNSKRFDKLTDALDFDPGVKESPLKTQAKLQWNGGPFNPDIASLSGDLNFELGKGHLTQVSDKGARIFSLFSLDSLVRKLSLDFSDVFGKGFYYNKFSGDLTFANGVVDTQNSVMDGGAGVLKVKGYTNLVNEKIDYDVRFSPHITSSVPTVVLLTTNAWNLGIGAFAISKVLEPVIEVISEIRFTLTGTISEPLVNETGRESKEIEVPQELLPEAAGGTEAGAPTSATDKESQNASPPSADAIEPASEPKPQNPVAGASEKG
ncbi:YhdP family protein [Paraferrimonas sedimenticola]|uniref:DUF3971 domain-containing protein n=1 Tax=Paraferrimonas sedimenticola TaxID=375674 RepID=A0AA37RZ02_9GAMM|nr:YhdP family protein [Paraferrimonas sedimenticola]GLP97367.1 DUF3971 domain-containing protein [Paraferrimonas sedimenticola]